MRVWDKIITERDRAVFQKGGYGKKLELGRRPAVLVVDVVTAFIGDRPEPILKSIERFPNSCGEEGWAALDKIKELLDSARSSNALIVYTASTEENASSRSLWAQKHPRMGELSDPSLLTARAIPSPIAPKAGEVVIEKAKPSPFFGTALHSKLESYGVDTLIFSGCTTSGCVRAGVVDSFSFGYPTVVVEECTFDRGASFSCHESLRHEPKVCRRDVPERCEELPRGPRRGASTVRGGRTFARVNSQR